MSVKFDPRLISLFKEVRNLVWLGYQIPHSVAAIARDAKLVFPYAESLKDSLATYFGVVKKAKSHPSAAILVAGWQKEIQGMISKGVNLRWEYFVNSV